MVGIALSLSGCYGAVVMPFSALVQIIFGLLRTVGLNAEINLLLYTLTNVIAWVLTCCFILLVTRVVVRPKFDKDAFQALKVEGKDVKLTNQMRWGIVSIVLMMIIMTLPNMMIPTTPFAMFMGRFGMIGGFVVAILILCMVPDGKGKGGFVFDFSLKLGRNTEWPTILFLAGVFFLGGLLSNNELSGFTSLLVSVATPLMRLDPLAAVLIVVLLCVTVTDFITNSVVALTFGAIGTALIAASGRVDLAPVLVIGLAIGTVLALAFPSASANAMVIHSQKQLFRSGQLIKWGMIFSLCCGASLTIALLLLRPLY